jgi:hypothetical protein
MFNRAGDLALREDQVRDSNAMMWIEIAGQGAQGAVWHADNDRWHVLERIRHG